MEILKRNISSRPQKNTPFAVVLKCRHRTQKEGVCRKWSRKNKLRGNDPLLLPEDQEYKNAKKGVEGPSNKGQEAALKADLIMTYGAVGSRST